MKIQNWTMNFMEHKNLSCTPPCSMYSVLLEHGLIKDPFYGLNELELTGLSDHDCEFIGTFDVTSDMLAKEYTELNFYGLDTLCDISLNGTFLAHTENMHRKYNFDVRTFLKEGSNEIRLEFRSPTQYFKAMNARHYLPMDPNSLEGASHLRKTYCMSGWDWGPSLPDMGIFRKIELDAYDRDRIEHTVIRQYHRDGAVDLRFEISTLHNVMQKGESCRKEGAIRNETDTETKSAYQIFVEIDGQKVEIPDNRTKITIQNPKLWWVRGLGEQNLYDITFTLERDGQIFDRVTKRIGLRTLTVSTAKVAGGNEFCMVNNGVKFFAMGANYIPQDSLYARVTPETIKRCIDDFVFANYNCVRVWGGGYYPDDVFFDLCDEAGLVVWEDMMIACAWIWLNKKMEEELTLEAIYQINRIAHHASLGILCGNNEMEQFTIDQNELLRMDYLKLYEHIFPDLCAMYAPDTFYWPGSPSSGGGFEDPCDETRGDVHYWTVWHGSVPFEEYRNHKFRFCSEYGFESFPNIKTIRSFCGKEDENAFSRVMENHQKCKSGNTKILSYLSSHYLYPTTFEKLVYASQILQADAIKMGVEHFRRISDYCKGSVYWQVNDCWPVASWSSVDYFGRYKALHYAARKFYAPVAIGIFPDGEKFLVNVSNETRVERKVLVKCGYRKNDNTVVSEYQKQVTVPAFTSLDVPLVWMEQCNGEGGMNNGQEVCAETKVSLGMIAAAGNPDPYTTYFYADLYAEDGSFIMRQTQMICVPKHFKWIKPDIRVEAKNVEDGVEFTVHSDVFAKAVELDFTDHDVIFNDNYIDLVDEKEYKLFAKTAYTAEELLTDMTVQSVYDIR